MTTKPRTKKFRIRRSAPLSDDSMPFAEVTLPEAGNATPAPAAAGLSPARPVATDTDTGGSDKAITDVRREGLTGRQLRMARRLAQKHGLAPTSDYDAVRQLRNRGIDPFDRANVLDLVMPDARGGETGAESDQRIQLPQTIPRQQVPSTQVNPPDPLGDRVRQIEDIQRDISRRRRRKSVLLTVRLAFFVALPTALAYWYFAFVATPMYATKSEFVIQQAEPATAGGLGGLFSGTSFATSQDSITVQSYLTSRDAMLRLDSELGFKSHFSDPAIDPIQRLPVDATNEAAYKIYQNNVEIGYDPTEGIIKMEVVAADPAISAQWSRRLITYAEQQVDSLTERLRDDQMSGARESFQVSETKMMDAQARVLNLQEELGVLDPTAESGGLMAQITSFETQLQEKRLQLQQLLDNRRPNQARVDGVTGDITRLERLISQMRSQLTVGSGDAASLASVTGELRLAEVDLQTRTLIMQQALQQLETARIEANRQVRYLSLGVTPVAPDEPTYPRVFENTVLSFLVFAGIYLMVSLTASILREQVST